jgi:hypothetical protein
MSESDLSLDESSFHISDYSTSTMEDASPRIITGNRKKVYNATPIQTFKPEVVSRQVTMERRTRGSDSISNFSLSGSSSGSPWVDDTGSSSRTTESEIFLSLKEQIRFDEARARLKATQKRPRSVPKRRIQHYDSSSSVCTGNDPTKPIDVTEANDISLVPAFLEHLRQKRQGNDESITPSKFRINEIVKDTKDIPKARIVGLLPSIVEGHEVKPQNRKKGVVTRPVPPIIVPEFCIRDDEVSSLGATFSYVRAKGSHPRQQSKHRVDLEHGITSSKCETDSEIGSGWIEKRTNLELFLIFLVASSSVVLIALVTIIFARN